jgi:hypothetical protein
MRWLFAPLDVAVCYFAPATPTNGQPITLIEYEHFNVRVFTFTVPRVSAMFNPRHIRYTFSLFSSHYYANLP